MVNKPETEERHSGSFSGTKVWALTKWALNSKTIVVSTRKVDLVIKISFQLFVVGRDIARMASFRAEINQPQSDSDVGENYTLGADEIRASSHP